MSKDQLRNNLVKMFNTNKENVHNEISRLASLSQRETSYRRNGMLNFGARQMLSICSVDYLQVGTDGPSAIVSK